MTRAGDDRRAIGANARALVDRCARARRSLIGVSCAFRRCSRGFDGALERGEGLRAEWVGMWAGSGTRGARARRITSARALGLLDKLRDNRGAGVRAGRSWGVRGEFSSDTVV